MSSAVGSPPRFSAVLLAGGASSRMGSPKALIDFGGRPLWKDRALMLHGLRPVELMISAAAQLAVEGGPWTVIHDRVPGRGPLSGIDAALHTMSTEWLLVLAVDMPAMTAEFLGALVSAVGLKGIVPGNGGLYLGLAAIYPRSIGPLVEEMLAGEDRSVQLLVRRAIRNGCVEERAIEADEKPLFKNVNRPGDLVREGSSAASRTVPRWS